MRLEDVLSINSHDRVIIAGGSESGKSTLAAGSKDYPFQKSILGIFARNYPNAKILIVDTKPRFRANFDVRGLSDKSHYKKWVPGATILGSTRIEPGNLRDLDLAMSRSNIIICQSDKIDEEAGEVATTIDAFRAQSDNNNSRLVYFDEVMDFYTSNGTPVRGSRNILIRCSRAGAERNLSTVFSTQRLKGIPPQYFELATKIYLFRLDYLPDYKRLAESGAPPDFMPPLENHLFKVWDKNKDRKAVYGQFKVKI